MTEKPTPVPPMGNRNVKNLVRDSDGERDWSFGLLCCCGDFSACCCAFGCPCIVHAKNERRLEHLNSHGYPDPHRHDAFAVGNLLYGVVDGCFHLGWILQIGTRQNIRERYNIRGSGFSDCCAAAFCTGCQLVQGHRELKLEEDSFPQINPFPQT